MKLILSHEHTDFDALASLLAAAKLHGDAVAMLPRQLNRNLRDFLGLYGGEFPFVAASDLPLRTITQIILVDTQTFSPPKRLPPNTPVQIIDHHTLSRPLEAGWNYWGETMGATATLLVEQICERGIALSPIEATLLLLGIYEDTGSLIYATTKPRDLKCAAWLLEQGANLNVVNRYLHHPLSEAQRTLYQQLADSSQPYEFNGQAILIALADAPGFTDEISTLSHKLQDLFEPSALFILVGLGDRIQIVARSTTDAVDVGQIATALGGGGHARAAAALLQDTTLSQARDRIVSLLHQNVKPSVTVAQIMSYGVQTLSPKTTVAEAAGRMQRYGHEGFPVIEEGQIVGMLTRGEIDRAMHHNLDQTPIRRYMMRGAVFVQPDDPVSRVQQVMTEQGWGQVPVVDHKGNILGIVTRTDLIKLWSQPPTPTSDSSLSHRLEEALPTPMLAMVKEVGRVADDMGFPLYVVGGFVRDLLLGSPILDLDLVVEGDAIALARRLAETNGGRVRSHRRFGTAKWILDEDAAATVGLDPSQSLDFVTARTEFYEHATALPTVEQSSVKLDLHRRDFTINTLAIRLDPEHWGELSDFYGGRRDLELGLIRVLHSLSFVEDPTRILRAARLETRLDFRLESRTEELISDALDLLDRVSGERIRHELILIFQEAEPERALIRLDQLGVLRQIHPQLRADSSLISAFALLRDMTAAENRLPTVAEYMASLLLLPSESDAEAVMERLRVPQGERDVTRQAQTLWSRQEALVSNGLRPSQIYHLLADISEPARRVFTAATESWLARQRVAQFERQFRHVRPDLDGSDLRRMGIPPGPIYRVLLDRLRAARLDGEVKNREEEETLVELLLSSSLSNQM